MHARYSLIHGREATDTPSTQWDETMRGRESRHFTSRFWTHGVCSSGAHLRHFDTLSGRLLGNEVVPKHLFGKLANLNGATQRTPMSHNGSENVREHSNLN